MSHIRKIAAEIVYSATFAHAEVEPAIQSVLCHLRPEHAQAMLFTQLALGTVQRAATLDSIIEAYSSVEFSRIEPRVLTALRAGAYEIVFLPESAPLAAMGVMAQTVRHWSPRACSFARSLLDAVWKGAGNFLHQQPPRENPRRLLQVGKSLWRRFDRDVFPDPRTRRAEYLAAVYSLPLWLTEKLLNQHGRLAEKIMSGCIGGASLTVVPNSLMTTAGELTRTLARQGLSVERGARAHILVAREKVDITSLPAYLYGLLTVMDEFDIAAIDCLNPRPGERVCVLQGRPQTMARIAQLVAPDGCVTGCVQNRPEVRAVAAQIRRLRLRNLHVVALDVSEGPSVLNASFDRVFVEPPSTGAGRLRRRAVARWRLKDSSTFEFTRGQELALQSAIDLCAAGGITVYTTSSLLREENEDVVQAVTLPMPYVKLLESGTRFPAPGGPDGGFTAKIAKLNTP